MTTGARDKPPGSSSARLLELDALRGLAALAVVVYHHGSHFHVYPLEQLLGPLYREGWRAVDFFFVLSGFVLGRAYWTEMRRHSLAANIWDRIARLYPLHLVTLIVVAGGQFLLMSRFSQGPFVYQINDTPYFVLNLLLLHGLDTSFNGPSWSISTEFVVNVLFFVVILLRKQLAIACMLAFLLLTLPSVQGVWSGGSHLYGTLRGFFFGVLLYSAVTQLNRRSEWPIARAANLIFVVTAAGAVVYAYLMSTFSRFSGGVTLLLFGLLVISAPLSSLASKGLRSPPLVFLGNISYSVYLVHFPLQLILYILSVVLAISWPYQEAWFLLLFIALTIGVAALTYHWIELPGKRWVRALRGGSEAVVRSEHT